MIDANKFVKILDWEDVSTMYKFRAQDSDGIFYYYDGQPDPDESQENFFAGSFNYIVGVENIPNLDWQNSLEERPVELVNDAEIAVKVQDKWYCGNTVQLINGEFQIWVHKTKARINVTPTLEWKYLNEL